MTMPTLIASYQDKVLETQYKKGISVLANAIQLMMAENETPGNMLQTQLFGCYNYDSDEQKRDCFKEYSKPIFKIIADSSSSDFQSKLANITYGYPKDSYYNDILGAIFPPAYAGIVHTDQMWQDSLYSFAVTDGITYGYTWMRLFDGEWGNYTTKGMEMIMDVNGTKNPNVWSKDMFHVGINQKGQVIDLTCQYTINMNKPLEAYECMQKMQKFQ